jgi:heme-degrading monooxygenase HmoA
MYARVVNFTGVKDIDGGISFFQEQALPVLRQQPGFRGATASVDRSSGAVGVLSLWETAADREASFDALRGAREEAQAAMGGAATVENYEQAVVELGSPPSAPGAYLLINQVKMDPARVDEHLEFFRATVAPEIKAARGFRGLRNLINRQTGEGLVGSAWDDPAALDAAVEATKARREMAAGRGVTFGEMSTREIVAGEMR